MYEQVMASLSGTTGGSWPGVGNQVGIGPSVEQLASDAIDRAYNDLTQRIQAVEVQMKQLAEERERLGAVLSRIAPPNPTQGQGVASNASTRLIGRP